MLFRSEDFLTVRSIPVYKGLVEVEEEEELCSSEVERIA